MLTDVYINQKRMSRILVHFIWENESISEAFIKMFIDMITSKPNHIELDKVKYFFEVLHHILTLQDSLIKKRTKLFIVPFIDILTNNNYLMT
jgi:hypothetical protein